MAEVVFKSLTDLERGCDTLFNANDTLAHSLTHHTHDAGKTRYVGLFARHRGEEDRVTEPSF